MKKKYSVPKKDKKEWDDFTKNMGNVNPKETDTQLPHSETDRIKKIDLHGLSLNDSNRMVKKFILENYNNGYKKLLIVTGKGMRSHSEDNPYLSEKLSVLKYAVPEFIKRDQDLSSKIVKISQANIKDGGEGAIYIFLKRNKNL